ncbi:hypothetical protein MES4922_300288 [Mesorhizobium ventifaucium]|uniref:Propionyl-coenzyme A carboxylase alpha polypeptide n=1 Tax=Mesorhizobium ventifaucium TaxID=666020 RepID=A0ABM9E3L3_9HYPH|nr:hypothetical protein MES4922_300288 [Mesorhizobium ventifaucium]
MGSSPHECGERWLGEAETERGTALYEGPLSGRFAATSPPLRGGRGTQVLRVPGTAPPLACRPSPPQGGDQQLGTLLAYPMAQNSMPCCAFTPAEK